MNKHIVYLASGSSRRFGGNKLLHPIDGKPMYLWGLETLSAVAQRQDCSLLVVSRYAQIRQEAANCGIPAIDCPDSALGISHSIRAGLTALGKLPEEDYLLFAVADQPYLRESSLERLLACAETGVAGASLAWQDRPGNPALFSARLIPELLALEGDTGGRAVLRRHHYTLVQVDSPEELEDIDMPK